MTPELYKALKQDGGFTVGPELEPYTGKGFAVSCPGWETRVPGRLLQEDILDSLIAAYATECRALGLSRLWIGGWLDDGIFYLDLSEIVATPEEAERLALERGQTAYFDFAAGKSVFVEPVCPTCGNLELKAAALILADHASEAFPHFESERGRADIGRLLRAVDSWT